MKECKNKLKPLIITVAIVVAAAYLALLFVLSTHQRYDYVIFNSAKDEYAFDADAQECYSIPITIKNKSNELISSINADKIYLSYHLYDSDDNLLLYDNVLTEITDGIFCGDKKTVDMLVTPLAAGTYIIEIDMYNTVDRYWILDREVTQPLRVTLVVQ